MRARVTLLLAILLVAAPAAAEPETVSFTTDDGLELQADFTTTGRKGAPAVIALHMFGSDRTAWARIASVFGTAGIDFLAVDLRGHGGSRFQKGEDLGARVADRDEALFAEMHRDALAAWRYLASRGVDADRVALLGASVGCSVAVDAAGREERIRGALLLTPGENYLGLPTLEHLKLWGERSLLVMTSEEEADNGPRAVAAAVPHSRLQVYDGYRQVHGTRMLGRVKAVEMQIVASSSPILAAPVAMDGVLGEAESIDTGATRTFKLEGYDVRLQSYGDWMHVAVTPKDGSKLPDRFLFTAAPKSGRDAERARAVAAVKSAAGLNGQYLRPDEGAWMPVRRRPVRGSQPLLLARADVLEMLVPLGRASWIRPDAHLRVGFAVGAGAEGEWTPLSEIDPKRLETWLVWPGK